MFGIPGLDAFGLVHALIGVAALLLGLAVVLRRKGTRAHRRIGRAYVVSLVLLNATALMPGVRFGTGVTVATALAVAGGAIVIHTRVPKIVSALAKSHAPLSLSR
jgi:hypothetical protein